MADEEDTKYCSNCKRQIASVNFVMHEMHCHRNIVLCKHCDEPVPRSDTDQHFEEYHVQVKCPQCAGDVEKMKLEEHQKNQCSKRPAHCEFCELELPLADMTEHMDYCGTRTEPCEKCGQFIMHKDQAQHISSGCQFPKPKKMSNVSQNMNGNQSTDDDHVLLPDQLHSNFAMGEIDRLMGMDPVRRAGPPPLVRSEVRTRGRKPRVPKNTKKNTPTSSQPSRSVHPDDEFLERNIEELQSLSLRHDDLDLSDDLEAMHHLPPPGLTAEGTTLPCEFCHDLYPADHLWQHQAVCGPNTGLPEGLDAFDCEDYDDDGHVLNNNRLAGLRHQSREPTIVNNLAGLSPHGRDSEYGPDEVMLPCEFCDQLFPDDSLVQHQAVCDANGSLTPRVPSPVTRPRLNPPTRPAARLNPSQPKPLSQLRSQPSHGPKMTNVNGTKGSRTDSRSSNATSTSSGLDRLTKTASRTSSVSSQGTLSNPRVARPSPGTGLGINSREAKVGPRPSRLSSLESTRGSGLGLGAGRGQQRSTKNGRSQQSFDEMVKDMSFTTGDLLEHMDKDKKSEVNQRRQRHLEGTKPTTSGVTAADRKRNVGAHHQSSNTRPRRTRPVPQATVGEDLSDAGAASALRVTGTRSTTTPVSRERPQNNQGRTRGGGSLM